MSDGIILTDTTRKLFCEKCGISRPFFSKEEEIVDGEIKVIKTLTVGAHICRNKNEEH